MTPLDHAATEAQSKNTDAARLRFFERMVDAELFLALEGEVAGETVKPLIFDTTEGKFVLGFDSEARLAEFTETVTPFVALSGRNILTMIAGSELGLALNPDAVSETLLPPDMVDWLLTSLDADVSETEAKITELNAPIGLPEELVSALDTKLSAMIGLARAAYLAVATYADGSKGHVLAFVDAPVGAEGSVSTAISETLAFSGLDAAMLDLAFLEGADPLVTKLASVGLRFDLPEPIGAEPFQPAAPGSDPDNPPKLR